MENYYRLFLNKINIKRKNFFVYNVNTNKFVELKPSKVKKENI